MATAEVISKEVEAFYQAYIDTFNLANVDFYMQSFSLPLAVITGSNVVVCGTDTDLRRLVSQFFTDLKSRGWGRTAADQLKVWPLADDLAMIVADVTRYKTDGSILEQARFCYTVRRDGKTWKIATILTVTEPFLGPGDLPR